MNKLFTAFLYFGRLIISLIFFLIGLAFASTANDLLLPSSYIVGLYALFFLYISDGIIISFPGIKISKPSTVQIILAVILISIILLVVFGVKLFLITTDNLIILSLIIAPLCIFIFLLLPQLSFIKVSLTKFERIRDYYSLYFLPVPDSAPTMIHLICRVSNG